MVAGAAPSGIQRVTWARLLENFQDFLTTASAPEVQRIVLLDGPAVLGWAEWRKLQAHYALTMICGAIEDGLRKKLIRPQSAEPLAHLILAMIDEAALFVANAPDAAIAARQATKALNTLLRNLA
jgi:hypothetical protein